MKQANNILIVLMLLLLCASCTERMNLELKNTDPRLVVEGFITTDTLVHYVRLSQSGDFFSDKQMYGVKDANVSISDGINTITLQESQNVPGYYITPSDFCGVAGRTYSLKIENIDINADGVNEIYTAESYLNPVTQVDSIRLEYEDHWELWKVLLYADEPADIDNYYMFSLIINDSLYTDQLTEVSIADDRFINGNYANGVWVHSIFDNDETLDLIPGDTVTLQMSGITKELYDYILALQNETGINVPLFSGPPANLPGNISNGALGFFRAYSNSYSSTIHTGEK